MVGSPCRVAVLPGYFCHLYSKHMQNKQLTRQRLLELLEYNNEAGSFTWAKPNSPRMVIGSSAGSLHVRTGYRRLMVDGHKYQEHVLVWLAETGSFPSSYLDHINGNRADNRIANLRLATKQQNNENIGPRRDNVSGFRGVSRRKNGQWVAQIQSNGVKKHLGYFPTSDAAYAAYTQAATNTFTHYASR